MNYLLRSKPRNEIRKRIILVVATFSVLVLVGLISSSFLRNFFYTISRPVWESENIITIPFRSIGGFFKFKSNLVQQNLELQDELNSLKLKEIDYDILLKENQDLKSDIGRVSGKNLVYSRVLSRPPRSPYDTFVIDIGSTLGVTQANRVYLSDNVIIGVVTTVTPNTSLVQLFSTGGNKQEAILSRTGTSFVLTGKGGANFQLEVPKDADIAWGDMFLYPGINSSILGSVYYIDINSQSSFKTIYIKTPGNVFRTKSVFVDTNVK